MRGEVTSLIRELQEACRRSLYNGNLLGGNIPKLSNEYGGLAELETASMASSLPATKRRRREKSGKPRSWETVSKHYL
jgi:hypothetical protein